MTTQEGARERLACFRETLDSDVEAALICRPEHLLYLGTVSYTHLTLPTKA